MSVLNDIVTLDGEEIRVMASGLWKGRAREFFSIVREMQPPRMHDKSYGVALEDLQAGVLDLCNHHWLDDNGDPVWGIPGGTWREFIDRISADDRNWMDDEWWPDTNRETDEVRARDMLLSAFLFPFHKLERNEDPVMYHGILQCIRDVGPRNVVSGTKALNELIVSADAQDEIGIHMSLLGTEKVRNSADEFKDFCAWSTGFSVATSTNPNDAISGATRTLSANPEVSAYGDRFLALSSLAAAVQHSCSIGSSRGHIARKFRSHRREVEALEAELAEADRNIDVVVQTLPLDMPDVVVTTKSEVEDMVVIAKRVRAIKARSYPIIVALEKTAGSIRAKLEAKRSIPKQSLRGSRLGESMAFRTSRTDKVNILGTRGIAFVRVAGKFMLITEEVRKALKFTAMSHSLWHIYAGTLSIEYAGTEPPVATKPDPEAVKSAEGHIGASVATLVKDILGDRVMSTQQEVVEEEVVLGNLRRLWDAYMSIMRGAVKNGIHDYLGRYIHEIFAVYTSEMGGKYAKEGTKASIADVHESYDGLGFNVTADLSEFSSILSSLPLSAVQDFGRLSKIVGPYGVNPIYSYIDRVVKMRKPSPRGKVAFHSEFGYSVESMTETETLESTNKLRGAMRTLLAIADLRSSTLAGVDKDSMPDVDESPWPVLAKELMKLGHSLSTSVTLRDTPAFPVPPDRDEAARSGAIKLIKEGLMPVEPFAGAYLDTTNIFPYIERGDPDMAILKATSVCSGDALMVFSNVAGAPRATPTRDTDGRRPRGRGDMVSDYLKGEFPSRAESIMFVRHNICIATTSDKVETNKYPKKTRVITGMCAAGRRVMSEFEFNGGKVLVNVPGFIIGVDPAKVTKTIYAGLRADVKSGEIRINGSLDISSFSAGMWWDFQKIATEELRIAFDGGEDNFEVLSQCTINTMMVRAMKDIRLVDVNIRGANYEGLDGKRNTFAMCAVWYVARCSAYEAGVGGVMRAWIYIDDGAFSIDVPADSADEMVSKMRVSLISTYVEYGHDLSILKTVFSDTYMQLLNEIYFMGIHVGYGFRALCHTGAQTFPECATASEELSVIIGGIRGAAVSGGHPLRLHVGLSYILHLFMMGVIGTKGTAISCSDGFTSALMLYLPKSCRGFGIANWTSLFSNLAGNRSVEQLATISAISHFVRTHAPDRWNGVRTHVKAMMTKCATVKSSMIADRVTVAHPASVLSGAGDRDVAIAKAASSICTNTQADRLIKKFVADGGRPGRNSFVDAFGQFARNCDVPLPMALYDKALSADPNAAVTSLVNKIASSSMVSKILHPAVVRSFNRRYRNNAMKMSYDLDVAVNGGNIY